MYKIFKINNTYTIESPYGSIPLDNNNSDYQRFLQDVAEQGIQIVEGPNEYHKSYADLRSEEYPTKEEQLDMQYWDQINGTTIWQDTITIIKEKYPKTITGGTTIGPVPDWVEKEVQKWISNNSNK